MGTQGGHWEIGELGEEFCERKPVPDSRARLLPEEEGARRFSEGQERSRR